MVEKFEPVLLTDFAFSLLAAVRDAAARRGCSGEMGWNWEQQEVEMEP